MAVNLKGRSFLTLQDFTPEEIRYLLDLGHDLKRQTLVVNVKARKMGHGLAVLDKRANLDGLACNEEIQFLRCYRVFHGLLCF